MKTTANKKQQVELADVARLCPDILSNSSGLCGCQRKALHAILRCRTVDAGGHLSRCTNCGHKEQSYNSCRNRHCPKCQFIKQQQWVDKLASRLMPGRYFHIVFTLPQELKPLFYINQSRCYTMLFHAASEALQNAGRNPAFLGGDVGALCVLHTWGQTLNYHPHIHMLVPAGGLSDDGMEWIESGKKFFLPIKALSSMYRGILIKYIEQAINNEDLKLPYEFIGFETLKDKLYSKNWNVYCKKAFGGINSVLKYLGKYTHRVAISNSRLEHLTDTHVTFKYRNYRQGYAPKQMTLTNSEFIHRFVRHVLPTGFCKIRYVGILATANIRNKREQIIALIGRTIWLSTLEGLSAYEVLRALIKRDPAICTQCKKGIMQRVVIDCKLE